MPSRRRVLLVIPTVVALSIVAVSISQTARGDGEHTIPSEIADDFDFGNLPLDRTLRALPQVKCAASDPDSSVRGGQKITTHVVHGGCCGDSPCLHTLTREKGTYDLKTSSFRLNLWSWIAGGPSYDSVDEVLDEVDDIVNYPFDPHRGGRWGRTGRWFFPEVVITDWTQAMEWDYDAKGICSGCSQTEYVDYKCYTKVMVGSVTFELRYSPGSIGGELDPHGGPFVKDAFPWIEGEEGSVAKQTGLGTDVGEAGYPVGRLAYWFTMKDPKITPKQCEPCNAATETSMHYIPNSSSYGRIGTVYAVNLGDDPGTFTIPDGTWLESGDEESQDMLVTDVPTRDDETPCGTTALDVAFDVPSETVIAIVEIPGGCLDFEDDPPTEGDEENYEVQQPDERSETLVDVVDIVGTIDFTAKPLAGMTPEQAEETACQAAIWQVESRIDDVEGNEVTDEDLMDRFFSTYETAVDASSPSMAPQTREELDGIVRDDLATIIDSIEFVAKQHPGEGTL